MKKDRAEWKAMFSPLHWFCSHIWTNLTYSWQITWMKSHTIGLKPRPVNSNSSFLHDTPVDLCYLPTSCNHSWIYQICYTPLPRDVAHAMHVYLRNCPVGLSCALCINSIVCWTHRLFDETPPNGIFEYESRDAEWLLIIIDEWQGR